MSAVVNLGLNLKARDASGQRRHNEPGFRRDATVRELIAHLVQEMGLATNDPEGRPHAYHAFSPREGRHLRGTEIVGDVLRDGDELRMHPDVQAGAPR